MSMQTQLLSLCLSFSSLGQPAEHYRKLYSGVASIPKGTDPPAVYCSPASVKGMCGMALESGTSKHIVKLVNSSPPYALPCSIHYYYYYYYWQYIIIRGCKSGIKGNFKPKTILPDTGPAFVFCLDLFDARCKSPLSFAIFFLILKCQKRDTNNNFCVCTPNMKSHLSNFRAIKKMSWRLFRE
jgi:hypothetical protein